MILNQCVLTVSSWYKIYHYEVGKHQILQLWYITDVLQLPYMLYWGLRDYEIVCNLTHLYIF